MCEEMAKTQAESDKPQDPTSTSAESNTPKPRKQSLKLVYENGKDHTPKIKYVDDLTENEQEKKIISEESEWEDLDNSDMTKSEKANGLHGTPITVPKDEANNNDETVVEPYGVEEKQISNTSENISSNNETSKPMNIYDSPVLKHENIADPDYGNILKEVNIHEDHFSEDYKTEAKKTKDSDE
jgi:hypothetical protein